jgi:hypothetical protein
MMPEIWLGSASLTNEKSPLVRNLAMAEIETIGAFNGSVFSDCFSALNASPADTTVPMNVSIGIVQRQNKSTPHRQRSRVPFPLLATKAFQVFQWSRTTGMKLMMQAIPKIKHETGI